MREVRTGVILITNQDHWVISLLSEIGCMWVCVVGSVYVSVYMCLCVSMCVCMCMCVCSEWISVCVCVV